MVFSENKGIKLAHFENLLKHRTTISHFVTTRHGGVSEQTYGTLNMGLNQTDNTYSVLENRRRLANAIGITPADFVFPIQVHGTNIVRVFEEDRGKGAFTKDDAFDNTDGFITNTKGLCLMSLAADCVPIVVFDPINKAIGVAHSGWKGTVLQIPSYLVSAMQCAFNSKPSDLIVGIGPSGGPCCYEVGQDVIDEVAKKFDIGKVIIKREKKTIFNLWEANRITLIESGVKPQNIEISEICTISQNDIFFSARQGDGGRFAAGIFLL
ncbi:MAG: peptidoglycan editing factor PgeF [Bacteroidales bacterium]|mgnify:CR=1 FL=1|jgi:YfiH family protein|nr:peptidoglycan editing factor PgeF [Bacteroidales bacterium]MDD4383714.1 peptidoglycan editing factor PgeF [Bacteroidales bacterium]MDY0196245.1 peptidoglycan editing factor PgeF [Tenuifilaceae bacterium]